MQENKPYYLPLDGLRAIAAFLVVFLHLGWFRAGWLGVPLFFVLSGFLITGVLLRDKESGGFFPSWKRFFISRSLRIFPLYFGFLFLLMIAFLLTGIPSEMRSAWPTLFTFSFNLFRWEPGFPLSDYFSHFWSLCVEEQFYFFWPFVVLLFSRNTISAILISFLCIAPLSRWVVAEFMRSIQADPYTAGDTVWMFTPCNLDSLAAGALVALHGPKLTGKKPPWFAFLSICAFLLCGLFVQYYSVGEFNVHFFSTLGFERAGLFAAQHVYTLSFVSLMFAAIVLLIVSGKNTFVNRLLENPFLVYAGKISFGMYVFHYPLIKLLVDYGGMQTESWFAPLIVFPLLILVSSGSFYLYEKRFLDMKERLT